MATIKQLVGTRTSLAYSGLATLATGTYVTNTTAYDCTVNNPVDVIVEVDIEAPTSPSGNKQAVIFIQESLDGTDFRSGPGSGTTTTDEPNLRQLGVLPLNTASATEIGMFSVAQSLGYVPAKFKIVVKNDSGGAFQAGTVFTSEISLTVA